MRRAFVAVLLLLLLGLPAGGSNFRAKGTGNCDYAFVVGDGDVTVTTMGAFVFVPLEWTSDVTFVTQRENFWAPRTDGKLGMCWEPPSSIYDINKSYPFWFESAWSYKTGIHVILSFWSYTLDDVFVLGTGALRDQPLDEKHSSGKAVVNITPGECIGRSVVHFAGGTTLTMGDWSISAQQLNCEEDRD